MMFSCLLSLVKCLSDINEIFTNFVTEFFDYVEVRWNIRL